MTTYTFPSITPSSSAFELVTNTRTFQSPLTNAVQTVARKGSLWKASLQFNNLSGNNRAIMQAFLTKLNGQEHRFFLPDHSYTKRGAAATVTVNAGAFVNGTIYVITAVGTTDFTAIGASANTVGVVFTATGAGSGTGSATANNLFVAGAGQTGSTLNVDNASLNTTNYLRAGDYIAFNNELHMVTDDVDSTGTGTVAIPIAPPIRKPTDNNDLVDFLYPVLGVFMLAGSTAWDNQAGIVSSFTIEAVEDVLA